MLKQNEQIILFHKLAQAHYLAFLELDKKFGQNIKHNMFIILYYHALRSIELLFKAFLLRKGYSLKEVKSFGHDLFSLMKEIRYNISLNEKTVLTIMYLSKMYKNKEFEYTSVKSMKLPKIEFLSETVKTVHELIEPQLLSAGGKIKS